MSIKDILNFSLLMFLRNKKKKFYIFIMIVCALLSIGIFSFNANFQNYLNQAISKNIGFRTLVVFPKKSVDDYGKSELLGFEHIQEVYSTKYDTFFGQTDLNNEQYDGKINLIYGSSKLLPKVVYGRTFESNETNVAICPLSFYPSSSLSSMKKENILDGTKLLNNKFKIKYYSYKWDKEHIPIDKEYEKEFEIVGLYSSENTMNFNNECFVSNVDLKEILDITIPNDEYEEVTYGFFAIVDDTKNVDKVIKTLEDAGFDDVSVRANIDTDILNTINKTTFVFIIVIIISIVFLTYLYTKKKILNEKNVIGNLRMCGYNEGNVKVLYLSESLITNIFSFLIGLVLFLSIYTYLKLTMFLQFSYLGIEIVFDYNSLIFTIFIVIILPTLFVFCDVSHYLKKSISFFLDGE